MEEDSSDMSMDHENEVDKQKKKRHVKQEKQEKEALQQELKEVKDKYLLLLAETENVRKRMQKEKRDTTRFAVENVISEFLSPLDNFENALSFAHQTSEETQNWAKGFEMILTQFKDILSQHQVVPFQSEGGAFDPHFHEVIEMEETEKVKEGMIIQEFVKGYKCGDRVLRPARVKVSKKPERDHEPIEEEHVNE